MRAYIYAVPEATPDEILIGLNDRDPALHDVYRLNLETGDRELLIENDQNVGSWIADLEGRVRLAVRQTADGGNEILRVEDGALGEAIYTCGFEETCSPVRFHEDGRHVYLINNRGEDVDLTGLYRMDATTGETELIETDPEGEVNFSGAVFSDASDELLATVDVGDRVRIYPKTDRFAEAVELLSAELPDGDLSFDGFTNDDRYAKVDVSSDLNPGSIYLFDWQEMTVEKLYDVRPELADEELAPMQPIRYTARDGLEIPGYLTVPQGVEAEDLALIVLPHGGPWSRDIWSFDAFAQYFANRGYAVFQPNFRGSTGYGKAFLNAGNKEWGTGAMQHDITERLESLTVDVASVEMPEPASGLDAAKTAPLPPVDVSRLALGAVTYSSRFTAQGQEIEMSAVRTIERSDEDGSSVLEVSDTVEGPMGGRDHYVLQADSLRPVSRQTEQGPATIEIDYGAKEVTGNLTVQGRETVTLEAPVFGDSAALDTAITALPLVEGYRTTVRSVEIGVQQRVRFWSVAVESVESVEVPAGSFEAFRVALEPLDGEPGGSTLWITEETPRRVVRAESELPPQAGGGTAVTELVSIDE